MRCRLDFAACQFFDLKEKGDRVFVIVSGGVVHEGASKTEAQIMRDYLEGICSVPSGCIFVEDRSVNSIENVQFILNEWSFLRGSLQKFVVVSQCLHAVRVKNVFFALGKQQVSVRACRYGSFFRWEKNFLHDCCLGDGRNMF
ncbi:MAG: YdcF family protein [Candidatus Moranbacteria bacterium]|nr:YdcF family protein [Candidatus Moranbacteria bacterium]